MLAMVCLMMHTTMIFLPLLHPCASILVRCFFTLPAHTLQCRDTFNMTTSDGGHTRLDKVPSAGDPHPPARVIVYHTERPEYPILTDT